VNNRIHVRLGLLVLIGLLFLSSLQTSKAATCRDVCESQYFYYTTLCEYVYPDPNGQDYMNCMAGAAIVWSDCLDACPKGTLAILRRPKLDQRPSQEAD
jgi:hypothetical protein